MARLKLAAALLMGALAATCWWGWLMLDHAGQDAKAIAEAQERQAAREQSQIIVYDTPAPAEPPLYYQADERWGGLPYATADSCVAESGCGLCCAAMAASYLTGEDITPPALLNLVGNRCIDGGVNHMGRFCEELRDLYGIEYRDLWTLEDAESHLRDGWMLFAGMEGAVYEGGKEYGGHVLLIWKCDEEGVYIRDPDDPTLQAPISWERFRAIEWGSYFYAIRERN